MGKIKTLVWCIACMVILFGIYLSAQYVLHGDIVFHTDIARDFLLMQDMVTNQKPALIGAKVGPIQGLFHGPLWLYLNLPAFLLGQGNPVWVGWGWVAMGILFLCTTYYVIKQIWNQNVAMLAIVFLSARLAFTSHQLFNPSGAIMLMPVALYAFWRYCKNQQTRYVVYVSLILGCMIQFQAALGVPLTILIYLAIIWRAYSAKKMTHLFFLLTIVIPLSTYVLFDMRHDFIQGKSLVSFLQHIPASDTTLTSWLQNRLDGSLQASYGYLSPTKSSWIRLIYLLATLTIICKGLKSKGEKSLPYALYLYLFIGYWLLSFLYPGLILDFYYAPLQVLTIIIFASGITLLSPILVVALLIPTIVVNLQIATKIARSTDTYSGKHASSWLYNLNLGKSLYEDERVDFGYFALSEDLMAYSPKYAIAYAQHLYPSSRAYLFTKKPITYVLISKDAYTQGTIDVRWWETGQVRITKDPIATRDTGYYMVKKYLLTDNEVNIPEDPNLMQGLQFR